MKKDKKKKGENTDKVKKSGEKIDEKAKEAEENFEPEENKQSESDKIAELEKQIQELTDKNLRRAAEFENYKRRTENERLNFLEYAGESFITSILPVYDDLHRSFDHMAEETNIDSLKKGIELVVEKFDKILADQGVSRIECVGKEFDFNFHEALMRQETSEYDANTVIQEVEPGYMYKDKVIRHAKVIVSAVPEKVEESETKNNDAAENE